MLIIQRRLISRTLFLVNVMPDRIEMLVIVPGGEWHERQVGTLNLSSLCQVKYPDGKDVENVLVRVVYRDNVRYLRTFITCNYISSGMRHGCLFVASKARAAPLRVKFVTEYGTGCHSCGAR